MLGLVLVLEVAVKWLKSETTRRRGDDGKEEDESVEWFCKEEEDI